MGNKQGGLSMSNNSSLSKSQGITPNIGNQIKNSVNDTANRLKTMKGGKRQKSMRKSGKYRKTRRR